MSTSPVAGAEDLAAQALGRVIIQYRESAKLLATIAAVIDPAQEVENALTTTATLDDIDVAGGVNLDVTGDLVGQGRELLNGDVVSDANYRLLIRARIARNQSHSTGEEILGAISLILAAPVILWSWGMMSFGYAVGRVLTSDEVAILQGDILPRPMGVSVSPREFYDPTNYFGFAEDPNATGFADDTVDPETGGAPMAQEF